MITGNPRSREILRAFSSLSTGARARLVAEQTDHVRCGADELDVACLAHLGQICAFRQEAIAGVDGVGTGDLGRAQHGWHAQVAVGASGRPDADVFVREAHVQRVLVRLGVHRDGLDAELAARADHPQRDLSPISDQNLLEH
jgi:hypothetical protein